MELYYSTDSCIACHAIGWLDKTSRTFTGVRLPFVGIVVKDVTTPAHSTAIASPAQMGQQHSRVNCVPNTFQPYRDPNADWVPF